ncbi:MAG: hypothetical protein JRH20_32680 [Deltaproteobacteria bacterium]|nr:hypothetical protein [Deltaproteobacteria bacterium]
MDSAAALSEIETLAEKLKVDIRYDRFSGEGIRSGGLCKIKGKWRVIIERRSSPTERLSVLLRALSRFDLEAHFLSPALRALMERYAKARAAEEVSAGSPVKSSPAAPGTVPVVPVKVEEPLVSNDSLRAPRPQPKPRSRQLTLVSAKPKVAAASAGKHSARGRSLCYLRS